VSPRRARRVEPHGRRLHTVLFHPPESESWLCEARHRDLRITMAGCVADLVSLGDPGGLVVFGAGFLHAPSPEAADALAEKMRQASRDLGLAFVFGIDVGPEADWAPLAATPESWVYACDAGKRVAWPARRIRATGELPDEERCLRLCGMRVGLVIASEVFNAPLRRTLDRARPDVVLVLTHLGPNARWQSALEGLAAIGPVVVTGETRGDPEPPWCRPPHGWRRASLGGTPAMTLMRYTAGEAAEQYDGVVVAEVA
jgi:hypothetical protein